MRNIVNNECYNIQLICSLTSFPINTNLYIDWLNFPSLQSILLVYNELWPWDCSQKSPVFAQNVYSFLCCCGLLFLFFKIGFLCVTALAVLEFTLDQASVQFTISAASAFLMLWLKVCATTTQAYVYSYSVYINWTFCFSSWLKLWCLIDRNISVLFIALQRLMRWPELWCPYDLALLVFTFWFNVD